MNLSALVLVVLMATATGAAGSEENLVALLEKYEKSQNTRDLSLCVSVFHPNATIHLPAGEPPISGIAAIEAAFKGFFASLLHLEETLTTPIIIHSSESSSSTPPAGGYSKVVSAVTNNGCLVVVHAVQTWEFDQASQLVSKMSVIYNTTHFAVQAACKDYD